MTRQQHGTHSGMPLFQTLGFSAADLAPLEFDPAGVTLFAKTPWQRVSYHPSSQFYHYHCPFEEQLRMIFTW